MNIRQIEIDLKKTGDKIYKIIQDVPFDELAKNLGLRSPRVIYDWVNGVKLPSIKSFVKLSLLFQKSIEDFISYN